MSGLRRSRGIAAAVGVVAVLTSATPAQAAKATVDCKVAGPWSGNPSVQIFGGSGSYTFQEVGTCNAAWDNGATDTIDLTVSSNGTFTNTICGGWATWNSSNFQNSLTATSRSGQSNIGSVIGGHFGYTSQFSNYIGDLRFTDPAIAGGGAIKLTDPTTAEINNPSGNCTSDFQVDGAIYLSFNDPNPPPPGSALVGPQNTSPPTISGTTTAGQTLTASPGSWSGNPVVFAYQWERCDSAGGSCAPVPGAVRESYTLTSADVGHAMRVTVTATNGAGVASAPSATTGAVQGAAGRPSSTCQAQGGANAKGDDEQVLGVAHALAFVWQASSTKVDVCARVESGTTGAGGLFEIDTGSSGVSPVVRTDQTDLSPCTQQIHESSGLGDRIYTTPIGTNPASICITVAGTSKRIDVGTTGSATVPQIHWTPDPGTPGPSI